MSGGDCCVPRRLWRRQMFRMRWRTATPSLLGFRAWMKQLFATRRMRTSFLRRTDLPAARTALEQAGFVYRHVASIDMFLDGPDAKARDAVHIVFAAEKVRADYAAPVPDVSESEAIETFRLLSLDALVRMKLTSFRDKDRVHLRDLMDVGLVDASWLEKVPATLKPRLQELLDNPEG
jgi:hypothetical protein